MQELTTLLSNIALGYILSVILFTYILIVVINSFRKVGLKTNAKRILSVVSGIALGVVYSYAGINELADLIPSYFIAVVGYDYLIKSILSHIEPLKHKK